MDCVFFEKNVETTPKVKISFKDGKWIGNLTCNGQNLVICSRGEERVLKIIINKQYKYECDELAYPELGTTLVTEEKKTATIFSSLKFRHLSIVAT